jgi:dienelactone hydrolase
MADATRRHEIALRRVTYEIPGANTLPVRKDIVYATNSDGSLTMDLYYPAGSAGPGGTPAVVFVIGYPDAGIQRHVGCAAKEMASYVSWAQLVAASGLVGVTCTNHDPADIHALIRSLRNRASELGIDGCRIALWSCSGNGPTALAVLMTREPGIRCAAFCYPYLLDVDSGTLVADAARTFKFSTPCAGRPIEDLPADVPLLIVRAGLDEMPGLNAALDRFVAKALERNRPITVVNHHTGVHAFDLYDTSEPARYAIQHVLTFLRQHT